MTVSQEVVSYGKRAIGRSELQRHLREERLTIGEAIKAKCYDCMGYFTDGLKDCEIPDCSLYPFMPYRKKG